MTKDSDNNSTGNTTPLFVSEKIVSEMLGMSPRWLQDCRQKNIGIPYYKVGKSSIRYNVEDVNQWLEQYKVTTIIADYR